MIIVDDCSTSREQLQQYVTTLNDPRITYIHNDINSGRARYVISDYAGARGIHHRDR